MSAKLSTHVLDTKNGQPAVGVKIELFRREGSELTLLAATQTNADGRSDRPLLDESQMAEGKYELRFHIGAYFRSDSSPPFLDIVPVQFGISDASASYHVPLLATPWSYSVYRGS